MAWFVFAKVVLGLSVQETSNVTRLKWFLGRTYNHLLRVYVTLFSHIPGCARWPSIQRLKPYFSTKTQRRILSPHFWEEALSRKNAP